MEKGRATKVIDMVINIVVDSLRADDLDALNAQLS